MRAHSAHCRGGKTLAGVPACLQFVGTDYTECVDLQPAPLCDKKDQLSTIHNDTQRYTTNARHYGDKTRSPQFQNKT